MKRKLLGAVARPHGPRASARRSNEVCYSKGGHDTAQKCVNLKSFVVTSKSASKIQQTFTYQGVVRSNIMRTGFFFWIST